MRLTHSTIFSSKLASISVVERRAVRASLARLRASACAVGDALPGLENAYKLQSAPGEPVVLYEAVGRTVTLKGLITAQQLQHIPG